MYERLKAQSDEAETQGLAKVASHLKSTLKDEYNTAVRPNNDFYSYSSEQLQQDVEQKLYESIIRIADFFGSTPDMNEMQDAVGRATLSLINEVQNSLGIQDGVGAYEPTLPGEKRHHVVMEVEDE